MILRMKSHRLGHVTKLSHGDSLQFVLHNSLFTPVFSIATCASMPAMKVPMSMPSWLMLNEWLTVFMVECTMQKSITEMMPTRNASVGRLRDILIFNRHLILNLYKFHVYENMANINQQFSTLNCQVYTMVTENVAIGDHRTPYDGFDIVVNLNFPFNKVPLHHIRVYNSAKSQHINSPMLITVGLPDSPEENLIRVLDPIITEVCNKAEELRFHHGRNAKILFHCFAGISRSTSLAIAYLMKTTHKSVGSIYQMVKNRRPIVDPNPGFVRALFEYEALAGPGLALAGPGRGDECSN